MEEFSNTMNTVGSNTHKQKNRKNNAALSKDMTLDPAKTVYKLDHSRRSPPILEFAFNSSIAPHIS